MSLSLVCASHFGILSLRLDLLHSSCRQCKQTKLHTFFDPFGRSVCAAGTTFGCCSCTCATLTCSLRHRCTAYKRLSCKASLRIRCTPTRYRPLFLGTLLQNVPVCSCLLHLCHCGVSFASPSWQPTNDLNTRRVVKRTLSARHHSIVILIDLVVALLLRGCCARSHSHPGMCTARPRAFVCLSRNSRRMHRRCHLKPRWIHVPPPSRVRVAAFALCACTAVCSSSHLSEETPCLQCTSSSTTTKGRQRDNVDLLELGHLG